MQLLGVCRFSLALEAQRKANKRNAARFGARGRFFEKKLRKKLFLTLRGSRHEATAKSQFMSYNTSPLYTVFGLLSINGWLNEKRALVERRVFVSVASTTTYLLYHISHHLVNSFWQCFCAKGQVSTFYTKNYCQLFTICQLQRGFFCDIIQVKTRRYSPMAN